MPPPPPSHPAFRHIDIHRVTDESQPGLVLSDPLGLVDDHVFVPEGLLPVVGRFDGTRSIEDIQREVAEEAGIELPQDFVSRLVRRLDDSLLLLSPRFERALDQAATAFTESGTRPARHAGSAGYPAEAAPLREALASMVKSGIAPIRPAPRGLVAPHIDLARGREGYAQAYGYLAECAPADTYVIFGTGHQGPTAAVTGLSLDWQTPLGTTRTDVALIAAVHERIGEPAPLDVYLHRQEHSLEFQVLMLQHVLGPRDFRVACFLTGALPNPDQTDALLAAFRDATSGRSVCFVAGADLAHVGPIFGDPEPVDDTRLTRLRDDEKRRLEHLEIGAPHAFHDAVQDRGNPDRVCGATPIFLAAALAGGAGEHLHYGQAVAPDRSQAVSFCSVAYSG